MKTKFSRKVLALVLAFALVVPMFVFTASAEDNIISFTLGADKATTTHADGSAATTYTEKVDNYTLSITDGVKMYTGANDATGKGCIKLGTGSAKGSCTINVPDDVTSIVIHVAAYKANSATVKINGSATTTLTTQSNNGEYDAIKVDTTTNKTVEFEVSSGNRAMLNQIDFIAPETGAPSLTLSGDDTVFVGKELTLNAELKNTEGTVEWTSSNPAVATVDGGVVYGLSMGTTTITATSTSGELSESKDITVYPDNTNAITIAEALDIAEAEFVGDNGTPHSYTVVGKVTEINTAYNESSNKINVTITDDTGSLYIFSMNGGKKLLEGQTIAVTGVLCTYSGSGQMKWADYELSVDDSTQAVLDALNALEAKMSLAYQYKAETSMEEVEATSKVVDTLNKALTGVGTSSYSDWSEKTSNSSAVYAGNSCGTTNDYIQLRSSGSTSGIVTTASGGKAVSITVAWNSSTADGRTIDIYGSNTAYTAASELYSTSTRGTKIGSLAKGETTLNIENLGDYAYIGIRSASGALYLTSVEITWAASTGGTEEKEVTTYSDSEFVIRCGIEAGLVDLDVDSYGIRVSAGDKVVDYTTTANSWGNDGDFCYVTISLGDIINDVAKLGTNFKVEAYVVVDGVTYLSEMEGNNSVATMIDEYNGMDGVDVSDLYNYLVSKGLI